jgi:hypothetical protein
MGVAMRCFLFAVAVCLTTLSSALADVRILASPGGAVGNYLNFFLRSGALQPGCCD